MSIQIIIEIEISRVPVRNYRIFIKYICCELETIKFKKLNINMTSFLYDNIRSIN